MDGSDRSLRRLLSQRGSYPVIAAAAASGQLPRFPLPLFEHVGLVYRRVETAADRDFDQIEALRLAALVHEQPPELLPELLRSTGVSDLVATAAAVIGAFGHIWKVRRDDELRDYVERNGPRLPLILLFELAHEGRSTPEMLRAAEVGGLKTAFERWAARLAPAPR